MINEKKILEKLENWADPLKKELYYEDLPLWFVFRQMFLTNSFPNRFFKYSVKNLVENINSNNKKSKKIISKLVRTAIVLNENVKIQIRKRKKKVVKNDSKKVLFFTQLDKIKGEKIEKIGNLLDEFNKQSIMKSYLLAYEPIEKNTFFNLKIPDHMAYDYINSEALKKAKNESLKLNKKWKEISEEKKLDLLRIGTKSIYPYIKNELNYLFSKEFLWLIILNYESQKKLLEEENIQLVCSTGAGTFYPKMLFAAAKNLGIPTFIMQHGICFGYVEKDLLNDTIFSVFGKHSKKELIEEGIKEENISVTGASIFDEILPYIGQKKEENIVTFLTDGLYIYGLVSEKEYFDSIKKWIDKINNVENIKIIIKTHPEEKEHLNKYKEIIKNFDNVDLISTPGKQVLYPIINKSKVIINFGSTAALEAMILDKSVITITDFHNSKVVEFDKVVERIKNSGASINLSKNGDISLAVRKVLDNKEFQKEISEKRKNFVLDSCYILDGNSSKRSVELIKKTLSKNSS